MSNTNSDKQADAFANANASREASVFNLQDFLQFLRRKWYWFLISVIVCGAIAWVHLHRMQNIYSRTVTILIKDPTFGNAATSVDLSAIGVMPKYANFRQRDGYLHLYPTLWRTW